MELWRKKGNMNFTIRYCSKTPLSNNSKTRMKSNRKIMRSCQWKIHSVSQDLKTMTSIAWTWRHLSQCKTLESNRMKKHFTPGCYKTLFNSKIQSSRWGKSQCSKSVMSRITTKNNWKYHMKSCRKRGTKMPWSRWQRKNWTKSRIREDKHWQNWIKTKSSTGTSGTKYTSE